MPEIKIFVDIKEETTDIVIINQFNAGKLGISSGDSLEILNLDNGKSAIAIAEVSSKNWETRISDAGTYSFRILTRFSSL